MRDYYGYDRASLFPGSMLILILGVAMAILLLVIIPFGAPAVAGAVLLFSFAAMFSLSLFFTPHYIDGKLLVLRHGVSFWLKIESSNIKSVEKSDWCAPGIGTSYIKGTPDTGNTMFIISRRGPLLKIKLKKPATVASSLWRKVSILYIDASDLDGLQKGIGKLVAPVDSDGL